VAWCDNDDDDDSDNMLARFRSLIDDVVEVTKETGTQRSATQRNVDMFCPLFCSVL